LRLLGCVNKVETPANFNSGLKEVEELIRIFVASVRTAKRNAN